MKTITIISAFLITLAAPIFSQTTATNFNCADCNSINHDLFSELNSGKIIVIAWVMPCTSCMSGALAGYSAVESFATSNPGQVLFYLVDDYANTNCSSLSNWGNTNGMTNSTKFSNSVISMSDYGVDGMPKVVVLGGADHAVFYNENNNNISQSEITTAISNALASNATGVEEMKKEMYVQKNPVSNVLTIHFATINSDKVKLKIINAAGQEVLLIETDIYESKVDIDVSGLQNGIYFVNLVDEQIGESIKVVKAN